MSRIVDPDQVGSEIVCMFGSGSVTKCSDPESGPHEPNPVLFPTKQLRSFKDLQFKIISVCFQ
jgi:hypothetical protein